MEQPQRFGTVLQQGFDARWVFAEITRQSLKTAFAPFVASPPRMGVLSEVPIAVRIGRFRAVNSFLLTSARKRAS